MKNTNLFFLSTESDETLSKWRWQNVKKVGMTPCPRSGISSVGIPGTNKVLFFGGVQDMEENDALDVNINFTEFLVCLFIFLKMSIF